MSLPRTRLQDFVLPFGKHKGKLSGQIDDEYLRWIQATLPSSSRWKEVADQVLEQRTQHESGRRRALLKELKVCSSTRNLDRGQEIHVRAVESGMASCIYVATALVNMYSKCGSMVNARRVFDSIKQPDVVSWTALILGYAEKGECRTALELFRRMKDEGCAPDRFTFVAALRACTSLAVEQDGAERAECLSRGKQIHSEIGCHSDIYVQSSLVDMYAKCGSMVDARLVFDGIEHPDLVVWTVLIMGYAENGEGRTALDMFARMKSQGFAPDSFAYVAALKACSSLALDQESSACLVQGRQIHAEISSCLDVHVQSALVDMYAKCGSMDEARKVFDGINRPDVVTWTALISGYAENGESRTALDLFERMRSRGCAPNSVTFVAALKACASLGALDSGARLHAEMPELDSVLVNALVDFYSKCGNMVEASKVFEANAQKRNLVTWNSLLGGFSRLGDYKLVFRLLQEMQDVGLQPNGVTFLSVLTCCSHAGLVEKAKEVLESMSIRFGISPSLGHYTCMIDIYGRSNKLDDAVALLNRMPCKPNAVTWLTVLGACRKWKNVEIGKLAFKSLVSLDDTNAAGYVLMAHIYGSRGMWEEQEKVLAMRSRSKAWKDPGQSSWIDCAGQVHVFLVGDTNHQDKLN